MTQNRLTMTFLFCPCYDIIIWAGHNANKVGVLAAVATKEFGISITGLGTFTQALAFIVGYAGRDFLENLYKIVLKKTSIYEIPAVLQKQ